MLRVRVDSHMHSLASGHAYSTIKEIFEQAAIRKMEAVAITDHAPAMPGACHEWYFGNMDCIPRELSGVRFLSGVELNILNSQGEVDLPEKRLKSLDVVIASLHMPCYIFESIEKTTDALVGAMNNPYIKIIGHAGDPRYPFDIEKAVAHAALTGTAIEINETAAVETGKRAHWLDTVKQIIRECVKQGAYISAGCDGHFYDAVGAFSGTEVLLNELEVPERLFVCRSYEAFMSFIKEKKNIGS